uniref:Uncharacterized protein n=1 Tax=Siphoviridae sp. ctzMZ8 TaxID=2827598 RepID=A0A8S5LRY3_9CAUD|nr:MAG TPA: hypothetical protein [Siphoviridae sp. ctzMZ8]
MGVLSILAGLQELALRTLQELAKTTTACSNAMNALDAAKADRLELHAVTIPAAGWKKDDYGCYIDLNMPGLTADDSIAVLIEPDSADAARAAVLDSTTQSSTDTLRLRAWKMPTEDLHAHYYTIREDILMALGTVAMGVGNYVLPPATADTLGGVMIGDGLGVDGNGTASFEPTTMSAVAESALTTRMKNHFYDKSEADKTNKALQEQVSKIGASGQPIAVWSYYAFFSRMTSYKYSIPNSVDYIVVKKDPSEAASQISIPRGKTGAMGAFSITFAKDGTLSLYADTEQALYFVGYHYLTAADGVKFPYAVNAKTCSVGEFYGTSFTVDTNVDYIVMEWTTEQTASGSSSSVTVFTRYSEIIVRGTPDNATDSFSSSGTVSISSNKGKYVNITMYHYTTPEELNSKLVAAESAQADADALNVDQDYRLTLLELGVTDDETTESA